MNNQSKTLDRGAPLPEKTARALAKLLPYALSRIEDLHESALQARNGTGPREAAEHRYREGAELYDRSRDHDALVALVPYAADRIENMRVAANDARSGAEAGTQAKSMASEAESLYRKAVKLYGTATELLAAEQPLLVGEDGRHADVAGAR